MMNNVTDIDVSTGFVKGTRRKPRLKVSAAKVPVSPVTTTRLDRGLHDALTEILRPGESFKILNATTVVTTYYR
ncbi:MAG TPA: hypothetical protein VIT65_13805 [Microlunatus sp.]